MAYNNKFISPILVIKNINQTGKILKKVKNIIIKKIKVNILV